MAANLRPSCGRGSRNLRPHLQISLLTIFAVILIVLTGRLAPPRSNYLSHSGNPPAVPEVADCLGQPRGLAPAYRNHVRTPDRRLPAPGPGKRKKNKKPLRGGV